MLNIKLLGESVLEARFRSMSGVLRKEIFGEVTKQTLMLERLVKQKLSGGVLNVRTGNLRASIHNVMTNDATGIVGKVASSGDVKYAGIHEFGGKTPAHVIEAKNGKALAFMFNGKQAFFAKVNHPGSTIPERSFLRSSLSDRRTDIIDGLQAAARRGVAKQ